MKFVDKIFGFAVIWWCIKICSCANILCVVPSPFLTHQGTFRPIWKELHARGHHLTLLTTDPMQDATLTNLTEIDLHFIYDIFERYNVTKMFEDETVPLQKKRIIYDCLLEVVDAIFSSPAVNRLISDRNAKFDLLITESALPSVLALSWRFNCPWIGISSMDAGHHDHHVLGNSLHPVLHPEANMILENVDSPNFWERVQSSIMNFMYVFAYNIQFFPLEHEKMKKYFGEDLPPLKEIQRNISMLFITVNPILSSMTPIGTNTIPIGGVHISAPKPLPEGLQTFLDSAKGPVIYFSLGSTVKTISDQSREMYIEVFSQIPYTVLWKFNEKIDNLPSNVRIEKWVPQQDVLKHPKVKLFITQAGLQSTQESLLNFVPMICIPHLGDQFQISQKLQNHGAAITLNKRNITTEVLLKSIQEVLTNESYARIAKELGEVLSDEPMSGLEKAVWWTEYVLRHKGAKYLRPKAVDLPMYQYYLLDVIGFIASIVFIALYLLYNIIFNAYCIRLYVALFSSPKRVVIYLICPLMLAYLHKKYFI